MNEGFEQLTKLFGKEILNAHCYVAG